jgi:hypothetical protein
MFKKLFFMTALLLFVAVLAGDSNSQGKYQWKLDGSSGGFSTYTSAVAGKNYIAARAIGVIPAKMEEVGMVIRDIQNYNQWMKDCTATKMLKIVNDQQDVFLFWLQQHVPILTDRDMVLKSTVVLNYKDGWCLIKAFSTNEIAYDAKKGYVRMPSFSCEFFLEWVDRDHTRVTFTIDPDLGKGVPVSIANSTISGIPGKTLAGMVRMVKMQKYIESAKTSKYNKMINDAIRQGYPKKKKK